MRPMWIPPSSRKRSVRPKVVSATSSYMGSFSPCWHRCQIRKAGRSCRRSGSTCSCQQTLSKRRRTSSNGVPCADVRICIGRTWLPSGRLPGTRRHTNLVCSAGVRCIAHARLSSERWISTVPRRDCFNLGRLWRTIPGGMAAFRRRVRKWVSKKLRIIPGDPPEEVKTWRKSVQPLLFPHIAQGRTPTHAEAKRLYVRETLLNGDGRQRDRVEHYENGCCRDKKETLERLLGTDGLKGCLSNLLAFPAKVGRDRRQMCPR